jgi:hypothetical protein
VIFFSGAKKGAVVVYTARMRGLILFGLMAISGVAHAQAGPAEDARTLLKALTVATSDEADEEMRERLLYVACSEIASCAGGCARELEFAGGRDVDASQRATLLASCFPDFRTEGKKGTTPAAWFRSYLGRYAERARPTLPPAEQKRLSALKAKLKLGAK